VFIPAGEGNRPGVVAQRGFVPRQARRDAPKPKQAQKGGSRKYQKQNFFTFISRLHVYT
jgi:hypothetical protein